LNNATKTDATQVLIDWSAGDKEAPVRLMPLIYEELRQRAAEYLRHERPDHTLQATALVHEAYVKLVDQNRVDWKTRAHFCGVAAQLMRRVLLEHARGHNAEKRGGKWEKLYLDETRELSDERAPDLIALDDALKSFTGTYPREGQVVELKFFGGLEANEIAENRLAGLEIRQALAPARVSGRRRLCLTSARDAWRNWLSPRSSADQNTGRRFSRRNAALMQRCGPR
jgi:RNA polymerase sigma factor (TIGR02999 family)